MNENSIQLKMFYWIISATFGLTATTITATTTTTTTQHHCCQLCQCIFFSLLPELAYWPSKNTAVTQPPMVRYEERPNHIRLEAAFDSKGRGGRTYFPPPQTMLNGNV